MSVHVVPNSGIFNDEGLDRMRMEALTAVPDASVLPESLVYYIRALEQRLLETNYRQKQRALSEIGWKFTPKEGD